MVDDPITNIAAILQENYILVIVAVGAIIAISWILKNKPKQTLKAVNRNEIERLNFIRRMEFNNTPYKTLEVLGKPKYRILKFQPSEKENIPVFEMVLKPIYFGLIPFGKPNGYIFKAENMEFDNYRPTAMILKNGVTTWERSGIFLDNTFSKDFIKFFTRDYTAQTDLESLSSIYYAAAQEQAVIDPNRAANVLDQHLEIERIKEERKKQQLGT